MKFNYTFLFLILFICGCTQDESIDIDKKTQYPLSFTSEIMREVPTRITDTGREAHDCLGVFIKPTGDVLSTTSIRNEVNTTAFITYFSNGSFKPNDAPVYFPQTNRVDFLLS